MTKTNLNKTLDNCIIACIYIYCFTFLFSDTTGYTFIRIAFVFGLIKTLKYNTTKLDWSFFKKYLRPIILLGAVMFLSLIVHGLEYVSISQYERLLKAMIPFFTILFFVSNKKHIYWMIALLFWGMIVNDFYAIYDYFINHNERTSGIDMGILYFSGILLLQLPVILVTIINKNIAKHNKIIVGIILLLTLFTIYTNGSRMTWLISIIDILIITSICIKSWRKKLSALVVLIICLLSAYTFNSNINERVNSLFDINNVSTRGHYFYLRDGFNLFLENKLAGVGLDNFKNAMIDSNLISAESLNNLKNDLHAKVDGQYVMPHAHNDMVMFLSELGILGGIAYIYLFGNILIYTFRNWYINKDLFGLAVFLMTINILIRGFSDYNIANLGIISMYFCLLSLYLKYSCTNNTIYKRISTKKYILFIYCLFIFIILLRATNKYLF